jgi:hypothetical protein
MLRHACVRFELGSGPSHSNPEHSGIRLANPLSPGSLGNGTAPDPGAIERRFDAEPLVCRIVEERSNLGAQPLVSRVVVVKPVPVLLD